MKPETIIGIVADYHNMSPELMLEKCNRREMVKPKYIAIYFCRLKTNCSLAELGKMFGYTDHSGICNASKTVVNTEKYDFAYRELLKKIGNLIDQYIDNTNFDIFMENDFYN